MGLICSGQTTLTPLDGDKLTDYLWPIVREIIKTAIENRLHDDYDIELMIADNRRSLNDCKKNGCSYILIDKEYNFDENIETLFVQ